MKTEIYETEVSEDFLGVIVSLPGNMLDSWNKKQ